MRHVLIAVVVAGVSMASVAMAQQYLIRPSEDKREMERRVWQLERAVNELQVKVYQLQQQPQAPQRFAVCSVSAFGKSYRGQGATVLEAKERVMAECTKNNHEMPCRDVKCEAEN